MSTEKSLFIVGIKYDFIHFQNSYINLLKVASKTSFQFSFHICPKRRILNGFVYFLSQVDRKTFNDMWIIFNLVFRKSAILKNK